jgi:hypothetical protein
MKFILLGITGAVLWGCNEPNYPLQTLAPAEKVISQYNDTTFISTVFISPFSEGYVAADDRNRFVVAADHQVENWKIIGRLGRGPGEYADVPAPFMQVGNTLYTCVMQKLYGYDLEKSTNTITEFDTLSLYLMNDQMYCRDSLLLFLLNGHEYNFALYNPKDGKIDYIHKNPVLNKRLQLPVGSVTLLDNGLFVLLGYDKQARTGVVRIWSITDENLDETIEVPLNDGVKEILKMSPKAPAFDGMYSWRNRIFIAFNTTGLVTTEIDNSGRHSGWTFLNYPDEGVNDRILFDLCITDKNLIFSNEGFLRFYANPFYYQD